MLKINVPLIFDMPTKNEGGGGVPYIPKYDDKIVIVNGTSIPLTYNRIVRHFDAIDNYGLNEHFTGNTNKWYDLIQNQFANSVSSWGKNNITFGKNRLVGYTCFGTLDFWNKLTEYQTSNSKWWSYHWYVEICVKRPQGSTQPGNYVMFGCGNNQTPVFRFSTVPQWMWGSVFNMTYETGKNDVITYGLGMSGDKHLISTQNGVPKEIQSISESLKPDGIMIQSNSTSDTNFNGICRISLYDDVLCNRQLEENHKIDQQRFS